MYRNSKGKQQVQQLRSAVVNLPTFLSWFSFRDTNKFATETKQSLSNLSLCVFKVERWLKRGCNILIEATSWFVWLLRRTSPLLHLSQDWRKSTCKQQWRGRSSVARLAADLAPPSKCPERSVKWLAAWALNSYLNLFVLMFYYSFCFVFPSVSLFLCFMGFSRSLRPGSKECSEHKNDWQYLSLGDLQQNELFPKSKSWGFLVP